MQPLPRPSQCEQEEGRGGDWIPEVSHEVAPPHVLEEEAEAVVAEGEAVEVDDVGVAQPQQRLRLPLHLPHLTTKSLFREKKV